MSALARTCLRLAACAALRNATLAGENVFDSRIEAVNLAKQAVAGAIAVYTEQEDGEALDSMNGPPFRPTVDLVLEISMQVKGPVAPDGSYSIGTPITDDELEASIDLIEAQAESALFRAYATNSVLFRQVARFSRRKNSIRFTDPQGGAKLATRYVTFGIEIADEDAPVEYAPTLTGFDRLPPTFAKIARAWPMGSVESEKALQIAAALAGTAPPAFRGVTATVQMVPSEPPEVGGPLEQETGERIILESGVGFLDAEDGSWLPQPGAPRVALWEIATYGELKFNSPIPSALIAAL